MKLAYVLIVGMIAIAAVLLIGKAFPMTGFLTQPGTTPGVGCFEPDSSTQLCSGESNFWKEHTWPSKSMCQTAADDAGNSCAAYSCSCRYLPE